MHICGRRKKREDGKDREKEKGPFRLSSRAICEIRVKNGIGEVDSLFHIIIPFRFQPFADVDVISSCRKCPLRVFNVNLIFYTAGDRNLMNKIFLSLRFKMTVIYHWECRLDIGGEEGVLYVGNQ